jgi:hypothetical protein
MQKARYISILKILGKYKVSINRKEVRIIELRDNLE